MKIIAGRARGRLIKPPPGRSTRPTLARVREAMFSALQSRLSGFHDLHVLDAFAGSGALGLEAWSRGATRVVCVEREHKTATVLQKNVDALDAGDQVSVLCARMPRALALTPLKAAAPFDLVLLDPPWASDLDVAALAALAGSDLLADDALVLVEHDAKRPLVERWSTDVASAFDTDAQKQYGTAAFTILSFAP